MMHHTTCSHTRWGFRQGVASPRGTSMTFMHPNFIRGDKQRCLLMRSIVKKPASISLGHQASSKHEMARHLLMQQRRPQMGRGVVEVPTLQHCYYYPTNSNTQQAFGSSGLGQQQQSVSSPGLALQVVPIVLPPLSLAVQNLAYQGLHSSLQQFSTSTIPTNRLSAAVASSAPVPRETTSNTMRQHRSEILERILLQQRQVELVRRILDRIDDGTTADTNPVQPAALLPPHNQPRMMPPGQSTAVLGSLVAGASFGQHHDADFGRLTTTGNIMNVVAVEMPAVVVLAFQIMKSNPGIEPWRALELAKKCLPGHDTFGSLT